MAETQREQRAVSGNQDFQAVIAQHKKDRETGSQILLDGSAWVRAGNFVVIQDLIKFMEGPKPKEGTPERKIYDDAVKVMGEGDLDQAVHVLKLLHVSLLKGLAADVKCRDDIADEKVAHALELVLFEISQGLGNLSPTFAEYAPTEVYQAIATLDVNLSRTNPGGDAGVARRSLATAQSPTYVRYPETDLTRSVAYRVAEQKSGVYVNGEPPQALVHAFGGTSGGQAASEFVRGVLQGYSAVAMGGDRASAVSALTHSLEYLKEINSPITRADGYKAALDCLHKGDLEGALKAMATDPHFSALLRNLDKFTVVTMDNKAFTYLDIRGTFELRFKSNEEFERARAELDPTSTRFIGFTKLRIGAHYQLAQYGGRADTYSVDQQTLAVSKTGTQQIDGLGHIVGIPIEGYLSGTVKGTPYHVVLYVEPGFETWELNKASVTVLDGAGQPLEKSLQIDRTSFRLGPSGLKFVMPGTGERRLIDVREVGFDLTGSSERPGFVDQLTLYTTLEGTAYEVSGFAIMGRARIGAALNLGATIDGSPSGVFSFNGEPVNFVIRSGRNTFLVGPTAQVAVEVTGSDMYPALVDWGVGAQFTWVSPGGLQVGAGLGYGRVNEFGPSPHGGVTGMASITIPFDVFSPSTAPTRAREAKDIPDIYAGAVTFASDPSVLQSTAAVAFAQMTAAALERNLDASPDAGRIRDETNYKAAIVALREGNLEAGLKLLKPVADKYPDVFFKKR
ncbi:Uncharacterised protein [Candidatus Bilamarchaeum dharawalense]|uniref:Uncharacterized protein n=1 Tax=Candidatus Bilamarchaeum dharawalense TaxID=2885759 RepID=A0A5E4LX25_9ARCH|nr:Uncharacterised protein [Candidatus Bilamarchaeum dharawalense]